MKKFIVVDKKIDNFFYNSFEEAKKSADDKQIIIEIEVKELCRWKKGGWQEDKSVRSV